MLNKRLQHSNNQSRAVAETIKSTLFAGLLASKRSGERFHYVREYGLDNIKKRALCNDLQPAARALILVLFRYNLTHTITPRGLRIAITPNAWRIAAQVGQSL